jgi:hypothetical protein
MWKLLRDNPVNRRKFRLFCCRCARRHCHIYERSARENEHFRQIKPEVDDLCRQVITAVEDDKPESEFSEQVDRLFHLAPLRLFHDVRMTINGDVRRWISNLPHGIECDRGELVDLDDERRLRYQEEAELAGLFREVFGRLHFRPITVDPACMSWHNATVPAIAQRIYDERTFHDLPILADALEEAGCINPDILAHCRGGGEHVRGCWVVDLILGKN